MTTFLSNRDIYTSVICGIVPQARERLWIATADIKDMYCRASGLNLMRICANTLPQIAEYARSGRVVVFDTETTGCSRWDEICQIAAVEYVDGVRVRTFSVYVCPTCEMNPWAEGIHGLSLDFLAEHGLTPEEAMRQFFEFLGNDALLVAHNNKFDMRMLDQECRKFDISFVPDGIETCDTVALARHLRPGLDSYSLANLIEALNIDGTNSHDALDDTLACAGLFFKLLNSQECRITFPT